MLSQADVLGEMIVFDRFLPRICLPAFLGLTKKPQSWVDVCAAWPRLDPLRRRG